MKKFAIIVTLALLSTASHAATIAYGHNKAGGSIVLTNERGSCKAPSLLVYNTAEGMIQGGCYVYQEPTVFVKWDDGTYSTYDVSGFRATSYGAKHYGN